jgi:endonuclease/exonuclease/phosphatase family metal-dependent hydrolase
MTVANARRSTTAVLVATLLAIATTAARAQDDVRFELSVMSFNINDLPAPLRSKSSSAMKIIGRDLARRAADGTAPDVVLLQEAFTKRSKKLIREAGYPHVVKGPGPRVIDEASRVIEYDSPTDREPGGPRRAYNRLTNSGLYILSRFPIELLEKEVYGNDCSGSDCLANKGIVYARIRIPGHRVPVDIATTHMDSNSKDASRKARFSAHVQQTGTLLNFLDRMRGGRTLILAGDLNIRDDRRYDHFVLQARALNAGTLCLGVGSGCAIDPDTPPQALTRDTNDYHFIFEGTDYRIEPVAMARSYGEKMGGKRLSDHAAFEVTYRLTPK